MTFCFSNLLGWFGIAKRFIDLPYVGYSLKRSLEWEGYVAVAVDVSDR